MQVIDMDSHINVAKGLEGTVFRVDVLAGGSQSFEFNARPSSLLRQRKIPSPGQGANPGQLLWDLDRHLEDLDRDGTTPPTTRMYFTTKNGRNSGIDSLQLTSTHEIPTPVNWKQGEDVIAASVSPKGWRAPWPYLRIVPQPT